MHINERTFTLEGTHISLQPMLEEHTLSLFEAKQAPELLAIPYIEPFLTIDDAHDFVGKALAEKEKGSSIPFVIVEKSSNQIIGSTRFLDISIQHGSLEIGSTWLTPKTWRTLINTECKYLLLRHSFETFGAIRVQIKTDLRNVRSQRAIERLGATREGVLRKHRRLHDGFVRDTVMYSIIDTEWPSVKKRLEQFLSI